MGSLKAAGCHTVADDADWLLLIYVVGSELEELCPRDIPLELEEGEVVLDGIESFGGDVLLRKPSVDHLEPAILFVLSRDSGVEDQIAKVARFLS